MTGFELPAAMVLIFMEPPLASQKMQLDYLRAQLIELKQKEEDRRWFWRQGVDDISGFEA